MSLRMVVRAAAAVALLVLAAPFAFAEPAMHMQAFARQNDGKVVVAGSAPTTPGSILVGRLNADGTMDPTFGSAGWAQYNAPGASQFQARAITMLGDGRIVVAAVRDGLLALTRLDASGAIDYSWGAQYPGIAIDDASAGFRANALAPQDGSVIAIGSFTDASTGNVPQAALVRYLASGQRDLGFGSGGMRVLTASAESELRAVVPTSYGGFAASGYARTNGEKNFLVARFLSNGDLDSSFGSTGWIEYNFFYGRDDEAFGIDLLASGDLVVSGRDGHTYGGAPQSWLTAVRFDPWGYPVAGYHVQVPFSDYGWDGDATARSIMELGTDLLIAGDATNTQTGATHFAFARMNPSGYATAIELGPVTPDADHLVVAQLIGTDQFFAAGTRQTAGGEFALRARYFADTLEFDTDYPTDGADGTPNPFAFAVQTGAGPAEQRQSGAVRITGINVPLEVAIQGGSYSIDCTGTFTSDAGTVLDGQRICLQVTSAATPFTDQVAFLNVGDAQAPFRVTTGGPPAASITYHPPDPSNDSVLFQYGVDSAFGASASFDCSLDGTAFAACLSYGLWGQVNYAGLAAGTHGFEVRATNAWGSDPTPAAYSWTVNPPPDTTITSGPAAATTNPNATFTFASNDPAATFECQLDGASYAACVSPVSYYVSTEGTHNFAARAKSSFGTDHTPATYSWVLDRTAPIATITSGPSGTVGTASAVFEFTSNEPGSTFQCELDFSPMAPCTSSVSYSGLSGGSHNFYVRAIDAAGNSSAATRRTWTIDLAGPDTYINQGVYGPTSSTSATFTFSASEAGSTFECNLDGAAWAACTTPVTYSGLAEGDHAFNVRALDGFGNPDPTPAWAKFRVDLTPPQVTITSAPSGTIPDTSVTIQFTSVDTDLKTMECRLNGSAWASCGSPQSYSGLVDASYLFEVRGTDTAGNVQPVPASASWTVRQPDITPPDTTLTRTPPSLTSSTDAQFDWTASESGASFEYRLDGAAWSATAATTASYAALASGAHIFEVRAIDAAGNVDPSPASWTWTVDAVAPDTAFTRTPEAATPYTIAQFDWGANESGVSYEFRLDAEAWQATTGTTKIYTDLAVGAHTFDVRAIDAVGNIDPTPASWAWTIDQTAPDSTITSGPSTMTSETSATFTFTSEPGATFVCSIDADPMVACASPITYTGLADGAHQFNLLARDAAGNWEQQGSIWVWTVDTSAPDTAITGGPSGTVAAASAAFSFSATDPSASFECALDGGAFSTCVTGVSYAGLADGMHTFEVRARDSAGNADATPASRTWSVDTQGPDTTISSGPSAIASVKTATFAFTASEGTVTFACSLDSAPYSACSSPVIYAALADGAHSFGVYSLDAVGNPDPSPATWSWIVDTTPPDTTITSGPSGNSNPSTATFAFTSNETGAAFQCALDRGSFVACTSPRTYSSLPRGSHIFQVRAVDVVGNVDATPATRTWKSN